MLRKILVALDGGPTSYDALNTAIELTQKDHGELILMSVVNTVNLPVNFGVSFNPDLADDLQNDSEMNLMLAKKILKNKHLDYHTCLLYGDPAVEILTYSRSRHVDLIVMGKPMMHGIAKMFSDSVAKYVSEHTDINTLMVG